jgi:hypothetical protein
MEMSEEMNVDAHILCIHPLVGNDEALVDCVVRNVVCESTHSQLAVTMHVNNQQRRTERD